MKKEKIVNAQPNTIAKGCWNGGWSSDIRLIGCELNDNINLYSRIIVAAGVSGSAYCSLISNNSNKNVRIINWINWILRR